ncbi:hypothetical protein HHK36_000945 [Tetracentron sinense]|uniref:Uncharacterized protein n=1 Tax=Tetracentron sinense TaxID=13715 RepID=A0A834ZX88_TETSI|nr:hypothetical protein HHK36_000945 [Tetracentron sinense]
MPVNLSPSLSLSISFVDSFKFFTILFSYLRRLLEVQPPSPFRYIIGAAIMMIGVVFPVGYMMFRNNRVPSSSSYSKQT